MIEVLPIKLLAEEDSRVFGSLSVALAKLYRVGFHVADGVAVTAPEFKLKSILEHFDFGTKEIFRESLTLVNKEISKIPVPETLERETKKQKRFFLNGKEIRSVKDLWLALLIIWMEQIKNRLWEKGFYPGITEGLEPQVVAYIKKLESLGTAFFDPLQDDVEVRVKAGKLHPSDLKKIFEMVQAANKKLFIPHEYDWVIDRGVKLVGVRPYTPSINITALPIVVGSRASPCEAMFMSTERSEAKQQKSAVKVFFELSTGFTIEKNIDGVYIDSGKIFDLNKPGESFEDMVFKLVESASTFPEFPILFKLADKSEGLPAGRQGMGKIRGTLRLLHQKSLFEPVAQALDFARHKKGLTNIHIVVPFIRGCSELLQIKRELAVWKLTRKNSLQLWMEVCVPENIVNLEDYLAAGIDGVVLNLDELISYLNGFDVKEGDLVFYKNEVEGLIKFLEDGIRLLHKSKVPFIAYGSLTLYPKVLEYLVEKGIYGMVVERYEVHSAHDLLHQVEKRMILRKSE